KEEQKPEENSTEAKDEVTHKGGYILDATVADQYIKYPTDVELLNDSRQKSEGIIDTLYSISTLEKKPRTYRRKARKEFLLFAKKKKKTIKEVHKAIGKQLRYLGRNLNTIANLLDSDTEALSSLEKQEYKDYLVIQEIYRQQNQMYGEKKNRCEDRIVSIHQPHVRPIVRGKQGKTVEFGSKVLAGITDDGYTLLPKMDWNAYNEGSYVIDSVEHYKKTLGYYPEVVIGDQIFITRANRKALEDLGIRLSGKSLGRKSEDKQKEENKRMLMEQKQRVRIEGKFGQGKNGYQLNKIRMRKPGTSQSMISMIFFVMNIIRYAKDVLFWPFLQIGKMLAIFRIGYASD
ncbi:MAG: transposase, partial [Bacteroidetes bacterium]|nr:transposase [Bacteroidota bacterium]